MTAQDDVDRIVDAWQRERPDLDFAPLHVLSRLGRVAKHLDRARKNAFAASGLETWEFDVLAALRRAGSPFLKRAGGHKQNALRTRWRNSIIERLTSRVDVWIPPAPNLTPAVINWRSSQIFPSRAKVPALEFRAHRDFEMSNRFNANGVPLIDHALLSEPPCRQSLRTKGRKVLVEIIG